MNCERYKFLINKYIDNEIGKEEINELLYHLEICEDCKLLLYDLKKLEEISIDLLSYKKEKGNYRIFVKIFSFLFIFLSFMFVLLFFKDKNNKKEIIYEESNKKVYLVDFDFKDDLILK